ncbi:unnamed protein product, partial [marine sediment metagenome]
NIINTAFELSGVKQGLTLLDIGSGRGGDVSKWRNYSKIVAVEPNPEHIVELQRRIALNGMSDRVLIVNTGGEDIVTIHNAVRHFIGGRVDVVSMMLSMSFFWRSQSMVNRLVNTIISNIKPDGKMIFLTIDGDLVEQTFEPAFDTGPYLSKLIAIFIDMILSDSYFLDLVSGKYLNNVHSYDILYDIVTNHIDNHQEIIKFLVFIYNKLLLNRSVTTCA